MKYEGSGGVRARVLLDRGCGSVRWTAKILRRLDRGEIERVALGDPPSRRRGRSRRRRRRPQRGSPSTSTRTRRSELRDGEAYSSSSQSVTTSTSSSPTASVNRSTSNRFIARKVETSSVAELLDEPGVGLERVERGAEVGGQLVPACASSSAVGVARRPGRAASSSRSMPSSPASRSAAVIEVRRRREPSPARISIRLREPALVRHADERGAVVVTPVRVRRREAVGEEALVRVDGRPEQRLQPLGVLDHAGDELQRERAQPCGRRRRERVAPVGVGEREVDVEARAALVGERPAHERRDAAPRARRSPSPPP